MTYFYFICFNIDNSQVKGLKGSLLKHLTDFQTLISNRIRLRHPSMSTQTESYQRISCNIKQKWISTIILPHQHVRNSKSIRCQFTCIYLYRVIYISSTQCLFIDSPCSQIILLDMTSEIMIQNSITPINMKYRRLSDSVQMKQV
jgi:hypothetical protein